MTGSRRKAREIALQILFQNEFGSKARPREHLARFAEGYEVDAEALAYAETLLEGILASQARIDAWIGANSSHWKTARMALVDLNVMRIATFEMKLMEPPLPPGVAINEAVEIAKKYGSSDSGGFVNGILDQIGRS